MQVRDSDLLPQSSGPVVESIPIDRDEETPTPVHPQDGSHLSQLPTDAVNCNTQLRGSSLPPQSPPSISQPGPSEPSQPSEPMPTTIPSETPSLPSIEINPVLEDSNPEKVWANIPYNELFQAINSLYDEVVFYRRNLFKIPSGKAGKDFVEELTFWLRQFNSKSKLNGIAIKAFMVLPTLLLQKPSPQSKAKQHTAALERRLKQWKAGEFILLKKDIRKIQQSFIAAKKPRSADDIAKSFAKLIMHGKISAALKLLDKEGSTGVLNLTDSVMEELHQKHPSPAPIKENTLLQGPVDLVPECFFEHIDEQTVLKAALDTKGSAGPSGMDAELYRRVLCSKNFSVAGKGLREEIALFARNLATKSYHPSLIEAYVASRLIPLDKHPGIRPIGIGEVLRRIVGKIISRSATQEIKKAAGPLQTCAGHGAGAEAAIHAMRQIFQEEDTDAILLIDASNAFNCLNRAVALHNIQVTCPIIANYLINTYRHPAKLFVAGGKTIYSREGTTQGDPLAMPWYSLSTVPIINELKHSSPNVKQVWLADDASSAGKLKPLYEWYQQLVEKGDGHGYYVNGGKSWLIVKSNEMKEQAKAIFGNSVNITSEGKRHLGAVIGSNQYKKEYCEDMVDNWVKELTTLCEIAETQPHCAYTAYTKGYRSKFTYFLRTIENFQEYVTPVDNLLTDQFIPKLFGSNMALDEYRDVLSLKPNDGGLGLTILSQEAEEQHESSKKITQLHVDSIVQQEDTMISHNQGGGTIEDLKRQNAKLKDQTKKHRMEAIDQYLPDHTEPHVQQARDKGASNWLNALPIQEQQFLLNKEEFRDALRLRYNLPLDNLPSTCPCGDPFNVEHALICRKGGLIHQRHDNIRDLLTTLLGKVCKDVEAEPHLIPITKEIMDLRSANTKDESRLDMKARGFWQRGQTAFFDVRFTHVNSQSQNKQPTSTVFRNHEQAKKREYMQRVLEVENGSFTPLVFGTNGGMGKECDVFISTLASKIASKESEKYSATITWIRTRLSFEILRSAITCVRGSRVPFRKKIQEIADFELMNIQSNTRPI